MLNALTLTSLVCSLAAQPDHVPLADWFGFSGMDVIPIGKKPGPMKLADMNRDGLMDVVIANNQRSRIEILKQKSDGSPHDPIEMPRDINEFPDHWRFERVLVPVADSITGMDIADLNNDGLHDLILGGPPGRITILRQESEDVFSSELRRDVRKLGANPAAFSVVEFNPGQPTLISVVDGEPTMWAIDEFSLGPPTRYPAGASIIGLVAADYDGDGLLDLAGISPDDAAPVRIWFGRRGNEGVEPGPQSIFEMPPISEFEAIEFPGGNGSRIGVIDRSAARIVLYQLESTPVRDTGDRDAAFTVYGFPDPGRRRRAWAIADTNGDHRIDVIAADTKSNAISVFQQTPTGGLSAARSFPSLANIDGLAAVEEQDGQPGTLLVLSTEEGVVGKTQLGSDDLVFPTPLQISSGYEPVAMNALSLDGRAHAAVISADKRNYVVDLIDLHGDDSKTIQLNSLSRKPDHLEVHDVDQDGQDDLIILTADRPMMLLLADSEAEDGFALIEKDDMAQYGLVAAANGDNIASLDVDEDGHDELLIASGNFVRAVRLERIDDSSWGWRVAKQFNTDDPDAELVAVTPLGS
ncbi:MAG: VCBS repeat-containing protein, partial [Phycisphaerales bacterium]|nr:VCBS repeat-containing protein [Phycisphaerales bacterium]